MARATQGLRTGTRLPKGPGSRVQGTLRDPGRGLEAGPLTAAPLWLLPPQPPLCLPGRDVMNLTSPFLPSLQPHIFTLCRPTQDQCILVEAPLLYLQGHRYNQGGQHGGQERGKFPSRPSGRKQNAPSRTPRLLSSTSSSAMPPDSWADLGLLLVTSHALSRSMTVTPLGCERSRMPWSPTLASKLRKSRDLSCSPLCS